MDEPQHLTQPFDITAIRSAKMSASSIKCVVRSITYTLCNIHIVLSINQFTHISCVYCIKLYNKFCFYIAQEAKTTVYNF